MLYILSFFLASDVFTGRYETPTLSTGLQKLFTSIKKGIQPQRFEVILKENTKTNTTS